MASKRKKLPVAQSSHRKSGGGPSAINLKPPEEVEKEYDEILNSKDARTAQFLAQVSEVFHLFDQNQNVVDVREVGCLIRSLGMYPSEAEVHEIIQVVEDPSTQGIVKYERFVPYAVKMLLQGKMYEGPTDRQIETAFEVVDTEKAGYFDLQRMKDIMMKDGEPFSPDEFDDMMRFGYNEDEQKFDWRVYMKKAGLRVADD